MLTTLREMFRYEAWADTQILDCARKHPEAWDDRDVRERLHHAHVVQRIFLGLLKGQHPNLETLEIPFASLDAFCVSVRQYAEGMRAYVAGLEASNLERLVSVPWFGKKQFTVGQILFQVVLHSQHHRGQNAARLKQLGVVPPTFDYIVWISYGKPEVKS